MSKLNEFLKTCREDIKIANENIDSTNSKFDKYLLNNEFNEYKKLVKENYDKFDNRITALHNNINPVALLVPDNEPKNLNTEQNPHLFLQHLFDSFHSEAKIVISKQNEKLEYIESLISVLKKNLNTNLYFAAKKAVTQFKSNTEKSNDICLIQKTLSTKSDISQIHTLENLKANKTDLEQLQGFTIRLNRRLVYVITMIKELTNNLITDKKESKIERNMKLSQVAYQLSLVHKSIVENEKQTLIEEEEIESNDDKFLKTTVVRQFPPTIIIKSSQKKLDSRKSKLITYYKTEEDSIKVQHKTAHSLKKRTRNVRLANHLYGNHSLSNVKKKLSERKTENYAASQHNYYLDMSQ